MLNALIRLRRTRAAVATTAVLSLQACYTFVPLAATATPRVGEQVRVVLTPEGTVELARYLGPNVGTVEGMLSSANGDGTIAVAVEYVQLMNEVRQPWSGEGVVEIPALYRREVYERVFQKRQSIVAATGLAAALVATAAIALKVGGAKGDADGAGGTPPPP